MCICQESRVNEVWAKQEVSACGFEAKGWVGGKHDLPIFNSAKFLTSKVKKVKA